ncbi:hypothetical protein [Desulfocucumis palustris]|uniref:hypothetical protein n=1 Tax=Desulfocucumis palustris TaxID=1898651 RepID=UPI0013FD98A6|nr:hypothetical protein [Desulfocucumis palustris]
MDAYHSLLLDIFLKLPGLIALSLTINMLCERMLHRFKQNSGKDANDYEFTVINSLL